MKFINTIVLICLASATGATTKHNLSLSAGIEESGGSDGRYGGTSTYYTTCYAPETSTVVITSCSEDSCETKSHETGITVVTTITLGVSTVFTTYCPLSTEHQVIEKTDSAGQVTTSTIPADTENPQTSDDCDNEPSDDVDDEECEPSAPTSCHTCFESTSSSAFSKISSSVSLSSVS
ncbi:Flocculin type 3 repeat-containing protein, partial [Debaryomyces fabryi]